MNDVRLGALRRHAARELADGVAEIDVIEDLQAKGMSARDAEALVDGLSNEPICIAYHFCAHEYLDALLAELLPPGIPEEPKPDIGAK
jgi:hypothetical protein